jgi:hypothetical protein
MKFGCNAVKSTDLPATRGMQSDIHCTEFVVVSSTSPTSYPPHWRNHCIGRNTLTKSGWRRENEVEQANQNVDTNQFLVDGLVQ